MENTQRIAIYKSIPEKDFKDAARALSAGVHEVDFRFLVRGTLNKGEPYQQRIAADADPWCLLALALSKLNDATVNSLIDQYVQCLADDTLKQLGTQVKARAQEALAKVKDATTRTLDGKITAHLVVTV